MIDLFEGRNATDLDAWLADHSQAWKEAVSVTVAGLHESFRASYSRHLGHATQVADRFHVVGVGTAPSTRAPPSAERDPRPFEAAKATR